MQATVSSGMAMLSPESTLFLQELKVCTAPQHSQLEQQALLHALMSPAVSLQQYSCYLRLMLSVLQPYEEAIVPLVQQVFDTPLQTQTVHLLQNDLAALGIQPLNQKATAYKLPAMYDAIAPALGFMYVMEGSKLGGKVIYKHINRVLGYTSDNGAGYLANKGADTAGDWKNFLHQFACYVIQCNLQHQAIEGARQAFAGIQEHFQNNRQLYAH